MTAAAEPAPSGPIPGRSVRVRLLAAAATTGVLAVAIALAWNQWQSPSSPAPGSAEGVDRRWEAADLDLPAGARYAHYDAATDTIWILTWPNSRAGIPDSGTILTAFTAASGRWTSYDVPGENQSLGAGAGLGTDRSGAVWMAWGQRLLRFQPADGRLDEWKIPPGQLAPAAAPSPGLDGMATSLALQQGEKVEAVFVGVYGESQVRRFDPAAGSWAEVPTGGLVVIDRSCLAVDGGNLLVGGVVRLPGAPSRPALALVDLATGAATQSDTAVYRFAVGNGDLVAFVGPDGVAGLLDGAGRESGHLTTAALVGPDTSLSISPSGEVWFWAYASGDVHLVRANKGLSKLDAFPYPLSDYVNLGLVPISRPIDPRPDEKPMRLDPGIRGLLVDIRGDVWVVSSHGSNPEAGQARGAYPVLYRFHP